MNLFLHPTRAVPVRRRQVCVNTQSPDTTHNSELGTPKREICASCAQPRNCARDSAAQGAGLGTQNIAFQTRDESNCCSHETLVWMCVSSAVFEDQRFLVNSTSSLLTVTQYTDTSDRIFEVSALHNIPIVNDMRECINNIHASCKAVDPQRFPLRTLSSKETWETLTDLIVLDSACVFVSTSPHLPCSLGNNVAHLQQILPGAENQKAVSTLNFLRQLAHTGAGEAPGRRNHTGRLSWPSGIETTSL